MTSTRANWLAMAFVGIVALVTFCSCPRDEGAAPHDFDQPPRGVGYIYRSKAADIAIIFVHGVMGSGLDTWKNPAAQLSWPEMVAKDDSFKDASVYVFDYPSKAIAPNMKIKDVADRLRLFLETDDVTKHKRLVFVAHSMGGLVTLDCIGRYRDTFAQKTALIHLYGTPLTGSGWARLAALISRNKQFRNMASVSGNDELEQRVKDWLAAPALKKIPIYFACETRPVYQLALIVEPGASLPLVNQRVDSVDADHIGMTKPLGRDSDVYRVLRSSFAQELSTEVDTDELVSVRLRDQKELLQRAFRLRAIIDGEVYASVEGTNGIATLSLPRRRASSFVIDECPGYVLAEPQKSYLGSEKVVDLLMVPDEAPPPLLPEQFPDVGPHVPSEKVVDAPPRYKTENSHFAIENQSTGRVELMLYICYEHYHEAEQGKTHWRTVSLKKGEHLKQPLTLSSGWVVIYARSSRGDYPRYGGVVDLYSCADPTITIDDDPHRPGNYSITLVDGKPK